MFSEVIVVVLLIHIFSVTCSSITSLSSFVTTFCCHDEAAKHLENV